MVDGGAKWIVIKHCISKFVLIIIVFVKSSSDVSTFLSLKLKASFLIPFAVRVAKVLYLAACTTTRSLQSLDVWGV